MAFEQKKGELREKLASAQDAQAAQLAAVMTLEQIAALLSQDEDDPLARQRQQAVMALAKRAPAFLRPARAEGQLTILPKEAESPLRKARLGATAVGAALLALLAVVEVIDGRWGFALLQAAGGALMYLGCRSAAFAAPAQEAQALGILRVDEEELVRAVGELCQAADVCVGDLALIEREGTAARLSGTADEAMLDLLVSLMEAKATGREDVALRSLDQAETYLRMLGVEPVFYDRANPEHAGLFDLLPTLSGERTIRPALLRDGRVIRRGVAACAKARGAQKGA
ncbi:MAG: hypothetical protein Q4G52_00130 [Clostridia bacterium]|nr:hypothetical protein [Clostridia bacterium]